MRRKSAGLAGRGGLRAGTRAGFANSTRSVRPRGAGVASLPSPMPQNGTVYFPLEGRGVGGVTFSSHLSTSSSNSPMQMSSLCSRDVNEAVSVWLCRSELLGASSPPRSGWEKEWVAKESFVEVNISAPIRSDLQEWIQKPACVVARLHRGRNDRLHRGANLQWLGRTLSRVSLNVIEFSE